MNQATYNFHDLFRVSVSHERLNVVLERELSAFRKPEPKVDLRVDQGPVTLPVTRLSSEYAFDDARFIVRTPSGALEVREGRIRAEATVPGELLLVQWVENLMRRTALNRGATIVHASAVSGDGRAYLFPAWAHTGKTNLALSFLAHGYDYMADDWCFVSERGEVLAYPRPLRLFEYNFDAHPQLIGRLSTLPQGKSLRNRLAATRFAKSLKPSGPLVSRLRRWILDRWFVYLQAPVEEVVPGVKVNLRAPLSHACYLIPNSAGRIDKERTSAEELMRLVLACNRYERMAFRRHLAAMAFSGLPLVPTGDEETVLRRGFEKAACWKVTLPMNPTPDELAIVQELISAL